MHQFIGMLAVTAGLLIILLLLIRRDRLKKKSVTKQFLLRGRIKILSTPETKL